MEASRPTLPSSEFQGPSPRDSEGRMWAFLAEVELLRRALSGRASGHQVSFHSMDHDCKEKVGNAGLFVVRYSLLERETFSNIYIYQINMLYILNLDNVICQLYLNTTGKKRKKQEAKRIDVRMRTTEGRE